MGSSPRSGENGEKGTPCVASLAFLSHLHFLLLVPLLFFFYFLVCFVNVPTLDFFFLIFIIKHSPPHSLPLPHPLVISQIESEQPVLSSCHGLPSDLCGHLCHRGLLRKMKC